MNRQIRPIFVILVLLFSGTHVARGSVITSFFLGDDQPRGGGFDALPTATNNPANSNTTGKFLLGGSLTAGENPGTTIASPNFVNLSTTVTDLHEPMTIGITVSSVSSQPHEYFFTVTMKNEQTGKFGNFIGPVTFELVADLDGDTPVPDFINSGITFDAPRVDDSSAGNERPLPTSDRHAFIYGAPGIWTAQSLTFGGLYGSGGYVPYGDTATFTFSMDIPANVDGTFYLKMTPNPEPASLFLAGLGLVGGGFLYRRRRKNVAPLPEADKIA